MSRMDFTPAETTVIGVRDSTVRSADSSKDSAAPRCTPPRPPVANTPMPARAASTDVAATVVPPVIFRAIAIPMSRLLTLTTDSSDAMRSRSAGDRPILATPSISAMVAAVTPASARIASNCRAASRLPGRGRPCEMIVDSRATTGAPAASAALTLGDTSTREDGTARLSHRGTASRSLAPVAAHVAQRLARRVPGQLVPDNSPGPRDGLRAHPGHVRGEQQARGGPEGMPGGQRLRVGDVERGPQSSRAQLGQQRAGVHDRAAGRVDQQRMVVHGAEEQSVYGSLCGGVEVDEKD